MATENGVNCFQAIAYWLQPCISDDAESGRLLAYSEINVTAVSHQAFCREILDSFLNKYLFQQQNINWHDGNVVSGPSIVVCPKLSRLTDDIKATLGALDIKGKPKIMLVVIHSCEDGVVPENLLTNRPDDRISDFTNILYSESKNSCYDSFTNSVAAHDIRRFIKYHFN
ncbi:uncharacterized protein LOC134243949 [Saccostrea cucullata]|uniref:uncharacterized protein LOC134243949 n=1 Tax=Saccostrea cuccullata TaxID=36930 RepID=UPI002ED5E7EB